MLLIISAFIIRIIIIIIIGVLGGRGDVKANQGSGRRCAQLHAGYGLQGSEAGRVGTDCAILDYCDILRQSCMSSEVRSLEPNIPAVSGRSSTAIGKVRVKGVDGTRPGVRVDYYWNKANNRLPYGWWWEEDGRRASSRGRCAIAKEGVETNVCWLVLLRLLRTEKALSLSFGRERRCDDDHEEEANCLTKEVSPVSA